MAPWLILSILLMQGLIPRSESGVVTGVVRLPDGKPAPGVRVAALVPPEPGLNPGNSSTLAAISQTDESGRYRLEAVPAGRYYIVAGRVDAPTYYPGVASMTGAATIAVTSGATLAEVDFVISPESARPPAQDRTRTLQRNFSSVFPLNGPPVPATGRIVLDGSSIGAKLPQSITLTARNDTRFADGITVTNGSNYSIRSSVAVDGTFAVTLQPGEARISVQGLPEGYSVKSMTSGSTNLLTRPLQVQAGIAEIVIVLTADLRPRFRVEGRVRSGATNRSLVGEQIELLAESGSIVRLILDAQGRFEFLKLLPGNYILRLVSPGLNAPEQRITVTDHDVTAVEFSSLDQPPRQ